MKHPGKLQNTYIAPKLLVYGAVLKLTSGGSKGDMETNKLCQGMNVNRTRC